MSWQAIVILVYVFIELAFMAGKDGQDRKGKHCFCSSVIAWTIILMLLFFGGFFE